MAKPKPERGDWVRFQWQGCVVMGEVLYRDQRSYAPWEHYSITDAGEVDDCDVLEIRRFDRAKK